MTEYFTFPHNQVRRPSLTTVRLDIQDAQVGNTDYAGKTLELRVGASRDSVAFRVAGSATLAGDDVARFMNEMGVVSNPNNLKGMFLLGGVDKETGIVYSLTPNLMAG